jgi:16S rRNA (guanine527-N7)-methyltransferase
MNRIADAADFAAVFDVSRETLGRLEVYAALLVKWQKTINLVAPSTLDDIWHRHFTDSAQVVGVWGRARNGAAGAPMRWVDLGSGAGFPGLVVGILLAERGQLALTLVDSDHRKAAFLREVVRETGLKSLIAVDIIADRIEAAANHSKDVDATVVSARALAPLPKLLAWAQPYFGPDTVGVFLKGREAATEVAAVQGLAGWNLALEPSLTDAEAKIVLARRVLG